MGGSFENVVHCFASASSLGHGKSCFASASRRGHGKSRGFTLVELLVTMAIILTLCAIAIPNLMAAVDSAKIARAVGDIRTIGGQVQAFQLTNGDYPDTLDEAGYGAHRDPWGNPYQYLNFRDVKGKGKMRKDRFLVPINSFFDLYSMGKDGKSVSPLTAKQSQDDIIWANDGGYVGLGKDF
jgi:general secretion pathway protein G